MRRPLPRPHETEEEAVMRRFHDAQRMARFRAKRKKAAEEARSKEQDVTKICMILRIPGSSEGRTDLEDGDKARTASPEIGKYSQLLEIIEELGREIRLTYAGSRSSVERLKSGIVQARTLVKDCLAETRVSSR